MPISDHNAWECELVATGLIVQDNDNSVSPEEAERRFNRYVALTDLVQGDEGVAVATALVRSIQVEHDYGAYQNTINKLVFSFPPEQVAEAVLTELPRLIQYCDRWAGDILSFLTRTKNLAPVLTFEFNEALKVSTPSIQAVVLKFIRAQEVEGWLEDKRGVLGV
jgi:hypothetical protein